MGTQTDLQRLAAPKRNPIRFVLGPVSANGVFTGAGVNLGYITEIEIDWDILYVIKRDPSSGAPVEVGRGVETPIVSCVIDGVNWDEDFAVATFTRTVTSLPDPTAPAVRIGGTLIPSVVPAWQPLLLMSDDPGLNSAYFARPIPLLSLHRAVSWSISRKAGLPLKFIPTPDSLWQTREPWQVARIANLTP